jgi:Cu2+-exporting ATPase
MAIGRGTDIAIESCDVVLVSSCLTGVVSAIRLGRCTLRNIYENLFFAFIYNVIGIPLAAGVFISLFGWELTPMFGALAMSLSSFSVVMNALRLNLQKIMIKYDKTNIYTVKEGEEMFNLFKKKKVSDKISEERSVDKIEISAGGIMCDHCKATVTKVLCEIPGVSSVDFKDADDYTSSNGKRIVVVSVSEKVLESDLKDAIQKAGYSV